MTYKETYLINEQIAKLVGFTKTYSTGIVHEIWVKPIGWNTPSSVYRGGIPDFCDSKESILYALNILDNTQKKEYIKELKDVISYKISHKITSFDLLTCTALDYSLAFVKTLKYESLNVLFK